MKSSTGVLLIALSLASCGMLEEAPPHDVLDGSIETLRTRFNADTGKVRAILLGSPT